jgi:hypothetical protein
MANPYGKSRPVAAPYAVYRSRALPGWEWHVLKVNQSPERMRANPLASAFCVVTSPFTGPSGDMGDTYVREIGEVFIKGEDVLKGVPRVTEGAEPPPHSAYGF